MCWLEVKRGRRGGCHYRTHGVVSAVTVTVVVPVLDWVSRWRDWREYGHVRGYGDGVSGRGHRGCAACVSGD